MSMPETGRDIHHWCGWSQNITYRIRRPGSPRSWLTPERMSTQKTTKECVLWIGHGTIETGCVTCLLYASLRSLSLP